MIWSLDLPGPQFLVVFLAASVAAQLWCIATLRRRPGPPAEPSTVSRHDGLDPFALSYLAGGLSRTVHATLATLASRGAVQVRGVRIERVPDAHARGASGSYRDDSPSLEVLLTRRALAELENGSRSVHDLVRAMRAHEGAVRATLVERGLLSTRSNGQLLLLALAPVSVVGVLGVAKVARALLLHRHVGMLVGLLVLHLAVALLALVPRTPAGVTKLGDRVLDRARHRLASLALTARAAPAQLSPLDHALACSVFGASVLASSLPALTQLLGHAPSSSDAGSCVGCGSSCSGGCSSCGGCA